MALQLMFFERPEFKIEVPDFILNAGVFEAKHRTELKLSSPRKDKNYCNIKVEVASPKFWCFFYTSTIINKFLI